MEYCKIPVEVLTRVVDYLESTTLPYKDVKAMINDIRVSAAPIDAKPAAPVNSESADMEG